MTKYEKCLIQKIATQKARIAVVGLGYVGLPLAVTFSEAGFRIHGIDLKSSKIQSIKKGKSYIQDVRSKDLKKVVSQKRLTASSSWLPMALCRPGKDVVMCCGGSFAVPYGTVTSWDKNSPFFTKW